MGAKKKNGDGGKAEESFITVVLKVDMHCDGCASKIIKSAKSIDGVEKLKAESESNKLTVVGKLDPTILRDQLASKTKKKVDLISPQPKKDNNKDSKADNTKSDDKPEKNTDVKKSKEPPVTTAVLKVSLHCQGCVDRIRKTVLKTRGVHDMNLDKEKELIAVKGTMDAKALAENLTEKLKRKVEIVPPKKEKEGGGDKEGGGNGGGKKKGGVGGGDKGNAREDGGDGGMAMARAMEQVRMGFPPPAFGYGGYGYVPYYGPLYLEPVHHVHPPQMFSDENPNACSIM